MCLFLFCQFSPDEGVSLCGDFGVPFCVYDGLPSWRPEGLFKSRYVGRSGLRLSGCDVSSICVGENGK